MPAPLGELVAAAAVVLAAALAVRSLRKSSRKGACCPGCDGCSGCTGCRRGRLADQDP